MHVISGIRQGSVLGLTLFLLFINDVADLFVDMDISCKLYADDIHVFGDYKTIADIMFIFMFIFMY